MSTLSITLIALLIVIILVPQRVRIALNQMFRFLLTPFQDLSGVTLNYISHYPERGRRLLYSAGITQSPYFGKLVGTVIITGVTLISIMADLELVVLTLEGVGIGEKSEALNVLMPLKPAECMSIALIGGAAMLGILFFDYFKKGLLPDNMDWEKNISKPVMFISAILLIGAVFAMGSLAKFRSNVINANAISEINKQADNFNDAGNLNSSNLNTSEQSAIRTYLFIYISLLTLVNGILGFLVLSPFFGLVACSLLAILLIPIGVIYFMSNMIGRLIDLLFGIFVAIFNVIQGVFNGLSTIMNRLLNIDDAVQQENDTQGTDADEIERDSTERQPHLDNNTNPNQPHPQEESPDKKEDHTNGDQFYRQDEVVTDDIGFDPWGKKGGNQNE